MNMITIPFENLKRKKMKTLLLIAVFSLGILSVVALTFVSDVVGDSLEEKMNKFGANIVVYPKTETRSISYGGMQLGNLSYEVPMLDAAKVTKKVRSIELSERISAVAPKYLTVRKVMGEEVGIIGVNMNEELAMKHYWVIAEGGFPAEENDIIVGSTLATRLSLSAGDTVFLGESEYTVKGVLSQTGSEDDRVFFANIGAVQRLTGDTGRANYVEVAALCSGCPIEDIVAQLRNALPNVEINAVQQVVKQRMAAVGFIKNLALTVSLVILLTACAMIALFMYSSVNERKKEIGILRAIGYTKGNVFAIFSFEALVVGVISAVIGYFGGFAVSTRIVALIDEASKTGNLHISFSAFALTVLVVSCLTILASSFPSYKAANIDPTHALVTL